MYQETLQWIRKYFIYYLEILDIFEKKYKIVFNVISIFAYFN